MSVGTWLRSLTLAKWPPVKGLDAGANPVVTVVLGNLSQGVSQASGEPGFRIDLVTRWGANPKVASLPLG